MSYRYICGKKLSMTTFIKAMKEKFSGTYEDVSDILGISAYDICIVLVNGFQKTTEVKKSEEF